MSKRSRVMVIDPFHQHFMKTGELTVDGREWSMVDIGFAQPVPIETKALMSEVTANGLIRRLITNHFWSTFAGQTSTKV